MLETQGGKTGGCGIPTGVGAVEAAVTVVSPSASGYLRAWPADATVPNATFINFTTRQSTTNTGSIKIARSGTRHLSVDNSASTPINLVVDIQGYWIDGTEPTVPGAPTNVVAVAGHQGAKLTWTAPAADGGRPVTGYRITPYLGATARPSTTVGATVSGTVTGLTDGQAYTFRVAALNEVGVGAMSSPSNAVTPYSIVVEVDAGGAHTCARWSSGALRCWGENVDGQLGDGTRNSSTSPVPVLGITTAIDVAAGAAIRTFSTSPPASIFTGHTCAVITGGETRCWGYSGTGQVGVVEAGIYPTPQKVGLVNGTKAVATGGASGQTGPPYAFGRAHSCALRTDGQVRCWGDSASLGTDPSAPTGPIAGLAASAIVAGGARTCALISGGAVSCWPQGATWGPKLVSGLTGITALALGDTQACALRSSGSVSCWKGTGTPVSVAGITNATSIAAGASHACAVLATGSVKCWGDNYRGQLGNGTTTGSTTPVTVLGITTATSVAAGGEGSFGHTCAVLANGEVRCWGDNSDGQLGNGTTIDVQAIPVTVIGTTPATAPGGARPEPDGASASGDAPGGAAEPQPTTRTAFDDAARYVPITPCRVVDTRAGHAPLTTSERQWRISGTGSEFAAQGGKSGGCGVPVGAVAVEATVTAVSPTASGYFRAWPSGTDMPGATFLNYTGSQSITNTGSIKIATTGTTHLTARSFGGSTHYVVDIQGYYATAAAPTSSAFTAITPCRVVDTRPKEVPLTTSERRWRISGTGSEFAAQGGKTGGCAIPTGAIAVEASITAITPTANGFLRTWSGGTSMPTATFLNYTARQSITNTGSITIATTGPAHLTARSFGGSTHYVVDIQGYYVIDGIQPEPPGAPTAVTATAGDSQAQLSWTAPTSNGGSAITGYQITPYIGTTAQTPIPSPGAGTSKLVTGLTNGTTYTFKIAATNSIGTGPQSAASNTVTPTSSQVPPDGPTLAGGGGHSCAVLPDGTIKCWGANSSGQLGNGTPSARSTTPVTVTGITTATAIAAGASHTCARLADGTVKCWGDNSDGQLGNGTTTNSPTPVTVTGVTTATTIAARSQHTCARLSDGTVQCWGLDIDGQLGRATELERSAVPVTVTGITTATAIAASEQHSCAVLADGTIRCWGDNVAGQLGNGTTTSSITPVTVTGITTGMAIAAGDGYTCARLAAGTVKCWGWNYYRSLGNGTTTDSTTPVTASLTVTGITTPSTIATGNGHTCARLADGTVVCWGANHSGQVGNGTTTESTDPVTVTGITTATTVSAGSQQSCARLVDGTVKCWGLNSDGQLGNGTTTNSPTPVTVTGLVT